MNWRSIFSFLRSSEVTKVQETVTPPLEPDRLLKTEEIPLPIEPNGENLMITVEKMNAIVAAVQTVENMAGMAIAINNAAPTAQQKLQAAIQIATTVEPSLAPQAMALQTVIGSLVNIFNMFGIFKKAAPAPAAAVGGSVASTGTLTHN